MMVGCFADPPLENCLDCPNPWACAIIRESAASPSTDCKYGLTEFWCKVIRQNHPPCPDEQACQLLLEYEQSKDFYLREYEKYMAARFREEELL